MTCLSYSVTRGCHNGQPIDIHYGHDGQGQPAVWYADSGGVVVATATAANVSLGDCASACVPVVQPIQRTTYTEPALITPSVDQLAYTLSNYPTLATNVPTVNDVSELYLWAVTYVPFATQYGTDGQLVTVNLYPVLWADAQAAMDRILVAASQPAGAVTLATDGSGQPIVIYDGSLGADFTQFNFYMGNSISPTTDQLFDTPYTGTEIRAAESTCRTILIEYTKQCDGTVTTKLYEEDTGVEITPFNAAYLPDSCPPDALNTISVNKKEACITPLTNINPSGVAIDATLVIKAWHVSTTITSQLGVTLSNHVALYRQKEVNLDNDVVATYGVVNCPDAAATTVPTGTTRKVCVTMEPVLPATVGEIWNVEQRTEADGVTLTYWDMDLDIPVDVTDQVASFNSDGECPCEAGVGTIDPTTGTNSSGGGSIASGSFVGTLGPDGTTYTPLANLESISILARESTTTDVFPATAGDKVILHTTERDIVLMYGESAVYNAKNGNIENFISVECVGSSAALVIANYKQ